LSACTKAFILALTDITDMCGVHIPQSLVCHQRQVRERCVDRLLEDAPVEASGTDNVASHVCWMYCVLVLCYNFSLISCHDTACSNIGLRPIMLCYVTVLRHTLPVGCGIQPLLTSIMRTRLILYFMYAGAAIQGRTSCTRDRGLRSPLFSKERLHSP
jgi:hypothetical protein